MLVTPVRLYSPDSFHRAESVQRSFPPRKTQETQDVSRFLSSTAATLINKDVIALTRGLDDDLEAAKKSVSAVFDRVREKITNTFGLRGADKDGAVQLLPPDDATGNEVLAFFSPENTAKRIVDFATGFFGAYSQNHSGRSNEENAAKFSALITDAVKTGFAGAQKVLGNPDEESEIGKNIEKTFQLVLQGIEEFQQSFIEKSPFAAHISDEAAAVEEKLIQLEKTLLVQTKPFDTKALEEAFAKKVPINLEPLTNPKAEDLEDLEEVNEVEEEPAELETVEASA